MAPGRSCPRAPEGDSLWMTFRAPQDLLPYLVVKGFVAIDGISLTITERREDTFASRWSRTRRALSRLPASGRATA